MSLFPAYAEQAKESAEQRDQAEEHEWLKNSSYKVGPVQQTNDDFQRIRENYSEHDKLDRFESSDEKSLKQLQVLSEASSDSEGHRKALKKHKKQRKRKHRKDKDKKREKCDTDVEYEGFNLDKKPVREYLTVNTISRPAVSKYHVKYYLCPFENRRFKKRKFKRYFKLILDRNPEKSDVEQSIITKENIDKLKPSAKDENYAGLKEEDEIKNKTEFYNKTLLDNPNNIENWLNYVNFQDTVYNFEKHFKKGSIAKAQRVLAERKISILEKALFHNPDCEELFRERIKVAVGGFPTDELQAQMKVLVEKDQGNIILWQGYIEATQCSMAHCNTPSVTALYTKCLATLHKLRRSTLLEKYLLEENILKMLYQCGLFLKQAGLFEQLWTLLKMYLELNLSPTDKSKFDVCVDFDEKQFQDLEEVIFSSQLPLHELWLRTEKLRESCHFLPVKEHENCGDPQRIVFTDDVVELIHPITMPENIFKFVATILTLLKVPLLPSRHCTIAGLGLDYVPWSVDSIESLLAVFFPLYPVATSNDNLLADTNRLAVGPQYLRSIPGQEEYLNLILTIFENSADCLSEKDQTALRIWWMRFQRLLIVLEKKNRFKMPQSLKKRIKNGVKNFLKKEENRNQEVFYLEYALIEREVTSAQKCSEVLKIALNMNKNASFVSKNWENSQAYKCLLHRSLVENVLSDENMDISQKKDLALESLVSLILQRKTDKVNQGLLMEADTKFRTLCSSLVENFSERRGLVEHFLPDFFTDFHICYGWFLYLLKGPLECDIFLEKTLQTLNEKISFESEVIYEFYCVILFKHCVENSGSGIFKILDDVLLRAIELFPNNLFLLGLLAKEQTLVKNFGPQWWKIEKILLKSERALPIIFSVVIYDLVWRDLMENTVDTITGKKLDMTPSYKNRMMSLFKRITKNNICTRRCGLVWRLFLQFVYRFFTPELCRTVYYSAVEECPWLKALYIDAAIYIPAELGQIQDLIIEKQLRLHVTPEELDILRN